MTKHKKNNHDDTAPQLEESPQEGQPVAEEPEEQTLEKVIRERDDYINMYKRAKADYINYQKRVEKEKQDLCKYSLRTIMLQLIPILEDFRRGLDSESAGTPPEEVLNGMKLAFDKLGKALNDSGLQKIETVGAKFDPAIHEAVTQEFRDDFEDMTVCEELHSGYSLKGLAIMPAKVKVARKPQPDEAVAEEE